MENPEPIAQFPKFTKLTYAHRDMWNDLIAEFPPIAECSFATLMTWWSSFEPCKVSMLNGNLVICYWIPGDEVNSGLGVVGRHRIDQTICEIFDWQHETGREARLVHVPEFVIERIHYSDMYKFIPNRDYDECVVDISKFAYMDKMPLLFRSQVHKALYHCHNKTIEVREIDLNSIYQREMVLEEVEIWEQEKKMNKLCALEMKCFNRALYDAYDIGFKVLGCFIGGQLEAVMIFQNFQNQDYVHGAYSRYSYSGPGLFELTVHEFAKYISKFGKKYANIDNDLGLTSLRAMKLVLGPHEYFRKYAIEPI